MARVLVVDDEAVITMQLEERISSMGHKVVGMASSGDGAITKARATKPDIILMDIVMPGKTNGIAAAKVIDKELGIPVIFITSYADDKIIEEVKQVNPYGYIVKPFNALELKATIALALFRKKNEGSINGRIVVSDSLTIKQKIVTPSGNEYKIEELLGAGTQGEVYRVSSAGKFFALKWYFANQASDKQKKALEKLISRGAPTDKFLWPLEIVTFPAVRGFGYIMQLRPKNYKNIVDLMKGKIDPNFSTLLIAGYNLADSYHHLHAGGWAYCDINFGNVFFDPQTGEILICDNDNVTVDRSNDSPVAGTIGFMAPEIVRGAAPPSSHTDRFSLAVLLFYMFFISHPLEGKKETAIRCFDYPAKKKLYGDKPIFIFDPSNDSNRPDPAVHKNAEIYWNIYPQLLKDLFIKSFTQGITNPENGRVRENEWRSALLKVRDMIVYCQKCNSENFCDLNQSINESSKPLFCWSCRKEIIFPPKMKIGSTLLVLNYNSKIYPRHLDSFSDVLDKPIAEITQNPQNPSLWGLKNLSDKNWLATKIDGSSLEILPGKSVALANNLKINFGKAEGEIQI